MHCITVLNPEIVRATEGDIRELAGRRFPDEATRQMYVRLAIAAQGGAWVARDAGTPIALAFARTLAEECFVSELYVEPSFRNAGTGAALLREVRRVSDDVSLSGLIDANDVGSLAFVARGGTALHAPVVRIAGGIARDEDLARLAAGDYRFTASPIDPHGQRFSLDSLDREVRGCARPDDHAAFAELASGTAFTLRGELVGYAYVWPDGRVGPLAYASKAYAVQFFAYALAALVRTYGASWCTALIPGSNERIMRCAVRLGLKVEEVHVFASDLPSLDLSRYVGFHRLLF